MSSPSLNAENNKVSIHLTVAPDKVKADAETEREKATELNDQSTKGANELVDQASDNVKPRDEE